MNSYLQEIELKRYLIEDHRPRIEQIYFLGIKCDKIAHFGCSRGSESLALSVLLKPHEITGLDKDPEAIQDAQDYFRNSRDLANHIHEKLKYPQNLSDEIRQQFENFANEYDGLTEAKFIEGDMTKPTTLPSSYFDIAYCAYVLNHIACVDSKQANEKILFAISEMARVIKPDGHIVAVEPQTCGPNGPLLNLEPKFSQVGLFLVQIIKLTENEVIYAYRLNAKNRSG